MAPLARTMSWSDPFSPKTSLARRGARFAVILAAHVGLLWSGMELATRPEVREMASDLMVRLIESPPELKQEQPQPKPQPQPVKPTQPPPVMAAAPETPAPDVSFTVAPPPPVVEAAPMPETPVVTEARFDAEYLSNPKPAYPTASRRLGEEGRVLLRVKVSPGGTALSVEIKQSSGFGRLDDAARAAVLRWRFVPARRGGEAIESWVSVPIVFSLEAS
jgi:periplasmic protein TonB